MSDIQVKAELVLGEGEFLKLNHTVDLRDIEVSSACLDPAGSVLEVSASSVVLTADQPVNIDILDGSPQTNVRLLILLADPV